MDVQLDASVLLVGHEHVEQRLLRNEQQCLEFGVSFYAPMDRLKRILEVMGDMFVEFRVFFRLDFVLRTLPNGLLGVQRLLFDRHLRFLAFDALPFIVAFVLFTADVHADRMLDEIRVLLDEFADLPLFEEVLRLLFQMEDDIRTARRLVAFLQRVEAVTFRLPFHAFAIRARTTRQHRHFISDHERRIETDAELSNQFRRKILFVFSQLLQKLLRAGTRDCTNVVLNFLRRHADTVVAYCQRLSVFIDNQLDFPLRIIAKQAFILQRVETDAVNGVRRIGNQFPQEDLLVRIQRVNDQIQQFLNFCLELTWFCHTNHLLSTTISTFRRRREAFGFYLLYELRKTNRFSVCSVEIRFLHHKFKSIFTFGNAVR